MSKNFFVIPVFTHFLCSKVSRNTKRQSHLKKVIISRDFVVFPVSSHFPYSKVSKNRKTTKSRGKSHFFKGFCRFFCFYTLFVFKSVQKQENDTSLEKVIISRDFVVSRHFPYSRDFVVSPVSLETLLEKVGRFKGFCHFPLFPDTSTELSAGVRPGPSQIKWPIDSVGNEHTQLQHGGGTGHM